MLGDGYVKIDKQLTLCLVSAMEQETFTQQKAFALGWAAPVVWRLTEAIVKANKNSPEEKLVEENIKITIPANNFQW